MTEQASWRIPPVSYARAHALALELGVSEVMAQVLVRRGYADAHDADALLHPDYRVANPYRMAGMREARHRLDKALQRGERIAVHGDYDADGITATFLLVRVLEELGADVRWHLPNRFTEGYGVSAAAVEELAAAEVKLLVTVDCGVGATDEVALARSLGMDVIVTDHHEIEGPLPECIVVTPKLPGYPCPHLAGVGVAFKLAHALLEEPAGEMVEVPLALRPLTDVVAIGTIADIVPLVEENRVLAAMGLGRLRSSPRPGLAALLEVAGVKPDGVNAGTVGFRIGPRLNAAGRLEDASLALHLLGCTDRTAALPLALRLNELNQERQAIEAGILKAAIAMVPEPLPPALVLAAPDWHEGVVGIVASRVAERLNRPTILLSESGDEAKGSGRSIAGFDLLSAVEAGAAHLLAFGGHRAACGLRLRRDKLDAFREAFVGAARQALTDADLVHTTAVDAVVCGDELTLELADELELLAPHGFGNRKVTLLLHDAQIVTPRLTRDRRHLQYKVQCDGSSCSAIHFNFDGLDEAREPGRYDIPLALGKNAFNGSVSAQVEVKGLHRLAEPVVDLCATSCDAGCPERLHGEQLWDALLAAPPPADAADHRGALAAAHAEGRLVDHRRRPVISTLTALAATGERVLVVVASVARRRPLLSRDVLPPQLCRSGSYVHAACAGRLGEASGADVCMTSLDMILDDSGLAAAFDHVALVDPPFTRLQFSALVAASPQAMVHALWGPAEVDFAARVLEGELDLDVVMRRVWRALRAADGRFDERLEQELVGKDTLHPAAAVAAALRVLREAALLHVDGLAFRLDQPEHKVDVTRTESYQTWRTQYQAGDQLGTCLTAWP